MRLLCFSSALAALLGLAACGRQTFELDPDASAGGDDGLVDDGGAEGSGDGADADGTGDDDADGDGTDAVDRDSGMTSCEEDTDLDGVCNDVDNCVEIVNPAQEDTDDNGVGDACEAKCDGSGLGAGLDTSRFEVSNIKIDGQGNVMMVSPGAQLSLALSYSLQPCTPGQFTAYQQLMIGFDDGSTPQCAAEEFCGPFSGSATVMLTAPTTPGTYNILADVAQEPMCVEAWSGGTPSAANRIPVLCVR